jgi:hypothetical protein
VWDGLFFSRAGLMKANQKTRLQSMGSVGYILQGLLRVTYICSCVYAYKL